MSENDLSKDKKYGLYPIIFMLIIFNLINSNIAMSAEKEALNRLLVTQVSQSEKLPPITYNPGKEWFKVNGTILDAPNNDFRFKLSNQNSNTATYTFYFDTNKFAGYLQRRGGIADVVTWFGPFALSDELKLAIKEYRCRTNQDSNY